MKKFFIYTLLVAFVATFSFTSCKDDSTGGEEAVAYETLTTYLKSSGKDLPAIIGSKDAGTFFAMAAPADGDLSKKWIMDIRGAADFAAGHIEGAHNVAFSDILTAAATADKPIIVVCYSGQTACFATSLLRLYGYPDTKALKWGMSGWAGQKEGYDKWTAKCGSPADNGGWSTASNSAGSFSSPVISASNTEGEALLMERIEAIVAEGFGANAVGGSAVLENPGNYYVNNFFSSAHYEGFGHVEGAVRVQPLSIDKFNQLDPNNKVVTYCYTGQTSAIITAYLNVCGFDAHSLTFGVNGLTHNNPFWVTGNVPNHWEASKYALDLPVVQ